ncbi:MAG: hypothetical protein PHI84_20255 [Kiritimatiellae bacterium]|nr:hypothetical protein [Kiritimatiellia bacterium]
METNSITNLDTLVALPATNVAGATGVITSTCPGGSSLSEDFVILCFVAFIALFVFIWAIWSGWNNRENSQKGETAKRRLVFWAVALLLTGCIYLLFQITISLALVCSSTSGVSKVGIALFGLHLVQYLQILMIILFISGSMFLVSLTMPWKKKE